MLKMLVIADDFTGALDTGVQFASDGIGTRVTTNASISSEMMDPETEVLVLDAETRHLSEQDAYQIVFTAARQAREMGIPHIYKKTDSALRGNVGAELRAVLDATKVRSLHFFPAFPKMNRITKGGIHYIDGVPVHESVFGKDPFEPVTCSSIAEMISGQVPVTCIGELNRWKPEAGVMVYDAGRDEELKEKGEFLKEQGELYVTAGCAGFANVLARLLGLGGNRVQKPVSTDRLLMACGSVNPITQAQVRHAEQCGFTRIRMTPEQKMDIGFYETEMGLRFLNKWYRIAQSSDKCIIDTNDPENSYATMDYAKAHQFATEDVRVRISSTLGYVLKKLIDQGLEGMLMIVGGDCLMGFMKHVGCETIAPICEVAPGVVLSRICVGKKRFNIISKSGGFGEADLLEKLADRLLEKKEETCIG